MSDELKAKSLLPIFDSEEWEAIVNKAYHRLREQSRGVRSQMLTPYDTIEVHIAEAVAEHILPLLTAAEARAEAAEARVGELEAALKPFIHAHDLHIRDDDADTSKPAIVQTGYFREAALALKGTPDDR